MSRLRLTAVLGAAAGLACIALPLGLSGVQAHDLPPNAHPGECFGKVVLPAVYGTASREILEHEGWTETRRTPDVVEHIAQRVLVRPAAVERIRTAAVYRDEVSWIDHPGRRRIVSEPARYQTVSEKVLISPGHAEWRRTDAPLAYGETNSGQTLVQATGEVVCRVWVSARYGHVSRQVLISPGRSYAVAGPGWRERVVRHIRVSDGGWIERRVPALYRTEYVGRTVRPGRAEVIEHPAVYRTVESQALIQPEREGWAQVLCGGAINPAFMVRVQQALIAQGFDPGPPDGATRVETYSALRLFQRQHRLAEGQLTVESARALGVI